MLIVIALAVGFYLHANYNMKYVCMYVLGLVMLPVISSINLGNLLPHEIMLILAALFTLLVINWLIKDTGRNQRRSRIDAESTILFPSQNEMSSNQNDDISSIKMTVDC
ncbi:hypothetical protein [Xenorhabdus sp. TH1]|uniref:hypothetical protein n=1 Tax=Xenorhabdus sp. TH1 TaxID=3130166 RepID=UPI0030CF752D